MLRRNRLASALALITLVYGGTLIVKAGDHSWSQQTTYVSHSHFISRFVTQDFVPDGDLTKPAWGAVSWVEVERDAFNRVKFPQSATEIASLWTPAYVYFAYRCKYNTLNLYDSKDTSKDFWELWERDVVEVFLNPEPKRIRHYYEFEVAPNNLWIDLEINLDKKPFGNAQWDSGYEHATHIDAKNHVWTCEMRIPVAAVNEMKPLEANAEWRLNFFRCDGEEKETQRRFISWSPVHNDTHSFHAPWSFGVIRFVK